MSFARFSNADIYMFEAAGGWIECCGCWLSEDIEDDTWILRLPTPREALAHLDAHEAAGHDIGGARERIEKEYPDLDIQIEPYVTPPEVRERQLARMRELFNRE